VFIVSPLQLGYGPKLPGRRLVSSDYAVPQYSRDQKVIPSHPPTLVSGCNIHGKSSCKSHANRVEYRANAVTTALFVPGAAQRFASIENFFYCRLKFL
jgi:hypothetical protein